MRKRAILWALLLPLVLAACGQTGELPQLPPEPETQEQGRSEEISQEPGRRLSQGALEYTNREENNNGFLLTEREEDGVPFLEFTRPDVPNFSLRINQDLTEAVVEYQRRTMTLERAETPNGALYDWYSPQAMAGRCPGTVCPSGWISPGTASRSWRGCGAEAAQAPIKIRVQSTTSAGRGRSSP